MAILFLIVGFVGGCFVWEKYGTMVKEKFNK